MQLTNKKIYHITSTYFDLKGQLVIQLLFSPNKYFAHLILSPCLILHKIVFLFVIEIRLWENFGLSFDVG